MVPTPSVYILLIFISFTTFETEAVTYYFNQNKTTNEFTIYNRVNLNNSFINSYPSTVYMSELRNNVNRKKNNTNETETHPLLDPEWDYNWKNVTRRNLPSYIYKFYESLSDTNGPIRILFNSMPNSTIIKFNLSDIDRGIISDVELHFYLNIDKKLFQKSLILRLYHLENKFSNVTSLVNPDSHKLINVIYVLQAESGWQVFKLSKTIKDWSKERDNLTLLITISRPNEEKFSLFNDTNQDIYRTFLILKPEELDKGDSPPNKKTISSDNCRKHDLHIDFAKLNWMKFLIAPLSYNAFSCYGRCYRSANLPNHIKVASFIPEMARKNLCCVPVQYSPFKIMFYDKNGDVAIKFYDDMVITGCGCR